MAKGRHWIVFLLGSVLIISFGCSLLILMEIIADPSPLLAGACAVAILVAVNLWGRRFGITR